MNIYIVGEPMLVESFSLIGLPGRTPEPGEDLVSLLHKLSGTEHAEIIFVQSSLLATLTDDQLDHLARKSGCLVVGVPVMGESMPDAADLRQRMQIAIGAAL